MRLPPSLPLPSLPLPSLPLPRRLLPGVLATLVCLGAAQALGAESPAALPAGAQASASKPLSDTSAGATSAERLAPPGGPLSPSTLGHGLREPGNLRLTSTPLGGVGLLRVAGADLGRQGLLRFAATGELFSASDFPVQGAHNTRSAGSFAASYVPLEFLEVYAAYGAWANTSSRTSPALIQALGDVTLGARVTRPWRSWLWAGVDAQVQAFSGMGQLGPQALGLGLQAVATADVRELVPQLPLRAHANLGLLVDGTGSLAAQERLNASEEYALGIQRYARLAFRLGVEAPLPIATPFLEYGVRLPLGVEGGQLIAPDGTLQPVGHIAPQTLGLGAKVTAVRDLTLTVAAEFGLIRQVGLGVAPTPPFNLFLGASYHVDVLGPSGPALGVERVREGVGEGASQGGSEVAAPGAAQVAGVVVDARTRQPVEGALVTVEGTELPPVASAATGGRFLTYALPAGAVRLVVRKEGYRESQHALELGAGTAPALEVALEPEARPVVLALSASSRGKPVAATLSFNGPQEQQVSLAPAASGPQRLELPAGRYRVDTVAKGFLAQTRVLELTEGDSLQLELALEPEPQQRLVKVEDDKLTLAQPVQFAQDKATLKPESLPLLAQVVDVLVRSGIRRLRVEGHTDNQGEPEALLELSRERARAVVEQLVRAGLEPSRLEAEGHGDTRPVAPNLTPRGRELNRRVEFIILER